MKSFFKLQKKVLMIYQGIGSYYYNKDVNQLYNTFNDGQINKQFVEFVVSEYVERREGYRIDALRWVGIIKERFLENSMRKDCGK